MSQDGVHNVMVVSNINELRLDLILFVAVNKDGIYERTLV